jgi:hypothetical protein
MARLIKAEDAAKWIRRISEQARPGELDWRGHQAWDNLTAAMKDCIGYCPTADAVKVVRCKDCKHFVVPQGVPCCDNFYGLGFPNANGNDFCSYGERRIDD